MWSPGEGAYYKTGCIGKASVTDHPEQGALGTNSIIWPVSNGIVYMLKASGKVIESTRIGHTLSITVLNTDGSPVRVNIGTGVPGTVYFTNFGSSGDSLLN